MQTVTFYKNHSPENYLNKTLTTVTNVTGVVLDSFSHTTPSVRVQLSDLTSHIRNFNYFQVNGCYYYLTDIETDPSGVNTIVGDIDLLMTYQDYVNGLVVYAERSTSHGNSNITDDMALVSASTVKNTINFPNPIPEDGRSGCYILTTSQAGY